MSRYELSPTGWTLIVPASNTEEVEIRSGESEFLLSLNTATDVGAARITIPPVPPRGVAESAITDKSGWLWTRQRVSAGIAVYAKAAASRAIATVTVVPR